MPATSPVLTAAVLLALTLSAALAQALDPLTGRFGNDHRGLRVEGGDGLYSGQIMSNLEGTPFVAEGGGTEYAAAYELRDGRRAGFSVHLDGPWLIRRPPDTSYLRWPPGLRRVSVTAQPLLPAGLRLSYRQRVETFDPTTAARSVEESLRQTDVQDHSYNHCSGHARSYAIDPVDGSLSLAQEEGWYSIGPYCEPFWVTPAVLDIFPAYDTPLYRVLREPFVLDERTYDAIVFHTETSRHRSAMVYDLASGLLLSHEHTTIPADSDEPVVSTVLRWTHSRLPDLPWRPDEPLPPEIEGIRAMRYRGILERFRHDGSRRGPVLNVDRSLRAASLLYTSIAMTELTSMHYRDTWARPPATVSTTALLGADGRYYLPPSTLSGLREGQLIDHDPISGRRLWVEERGEHGLVMAVADAGLSQRLVYSYGTGLLLYQREERRTAEGWEVLTLDLFEPR